MNAIATYDTRSGLEFIFVVFATVTTFILVVLSVQLYRCLMEQDRAITRNQGLDQRDQLLEIVKRAILWIIGYKGEEREKASVQEIDLNWINRYSGSIILRFVPIYAVYIFSLLMLTRPVFLEGNQYATFGYSQDPVWLYTMLLVYVASNVIFDYLSLRFSYRHILNAQTSKRYIFYFVKDGIYAAILFLPSQIISCFLWVFKRENREFPGMQDSLLQNFWDISLWPYAFVSHYGATDVTGQLFPGQLLITGTVFFPTIALVSIFVVFSIFLKLSLYTKRLLLKLDLDRLCRIYLKINLVGIFEPKDKVARFGYCNLAMLVVLQLIMVTAISQLVDIIVG